MNLNNVLQALLVLSVVLTVSGLLLLVHRVSLFNRTKWSFK